MEGYVLSADFRKISKFCYKATFVLLATYLLFSLSVVFAVVKGWLEQSEFFLDIGGYIFVPLILICILTMAIYALGYICHLWVIGEHKEAINGLVTFLLLNILTGYIWFYQSEIKGKAIQFKVF